jgi:hypothetical protein
VAGVKLLESEECEQVALSRLKQEISKLSGDLQAVGEESCPAAKKAVAAQR